MRISKQSTLGVLVIGCLGAAIVAGILASPWRGPQCPEVAAPPSLLYVCCTDNGCVAGIDPADCMGDLFWCEVGESAVGPNGEPQVVCHD